MAKFLLIFALFIAFAFPVAAAESANCQPCQVESECRAKDSSTEWLCVGDKDAGDKKIEGYCQPKGKVVFCNPLGSSGLTGLVDRLLNFAFNAAIIATPILFIWAGAKFMLAKGPEDAESAKKIMIWIVIGFGIILLSRGFIFIIRGILGI